MVSSGLALHTTTGDLGVAIIDSLGNQRWESWDLGRQLASEIQVKLAGFIQPLSWQDLDFITVAIGPGSYTSTRIGVVVAKTLAQQLQIPVYGVSSLIAIAWSHHHQLIPHQLIAVNIPAHNDDLFGAIYQYCGIHKEMKTILSEQKLTQDKWLEIIKAQRKERDNINIAKTPEKILFTVSNLLEIGLLKHDNNHQKEIYHWSKLNAFYE